MLIAIFDMDMPRKCEWDCPFCNGEGGWCQLADVNISEDERPKECPLHETAEINKVLDEIRAEIWDLQYGDEEKSMTDEDRADAYNNAIIQAIEIIDKCRAESEE